MRERTAGRKINCSLLWPCHLLRRTRRQAGVECMNLASSTAIAMSQIRATFVGQLIAPVCYLFHLVLYSDGLKGQIPLEKEIKQSLIYMHIFESHISEKLSSTI
jgi:hypothetical protein